MKMTEKIEAFIRGEKLIESGQTIGCAISGGADSTALLLCLQALSGKLGIRLAAVHFEHGIRGMESYRDAAFVRDLCDRTGIPLYMRSGNIPEMARQQKISVELAARNARQAFFAELHEAGTVDAVATAHHLHDNAESLLLHLIRGSGLDGLVGIRSKRGFLIRPLLCVERNEIRAFLRERGQEWMEDSTNTDTQYARNYLRHDVMPALAKMNPEIVQALCRTGRAAAGDLDYLAAESAKLASRIVSYVNGTAQVKREALCAAHPALAARVVRMALAAVGRPGDLHYCHIRAVMELAHAGRAGAAADLGGGYRAEVAYDNILLGHKEAAAPYMVPLNPEGTSLFPGGTLEGSVVSVRGGGAPFSEYFDKNRIRPGAVIRTRRPGDRFFPLGAPGHRKLKDYFIDIKLPRAERDKVPLLADGPQILWVIGHRIAQDAAVTEHTKEILHLRCRCS